MIRVNNMNDLLPKYLQSRNKIWCDGTNLKVVGNEKEGGSGKWQMIDIGLGLW